MLLNIVYFQVLFSVRAIFTLQILDFSKPDAPLTPEQKRRRNLRFNLTLLAVLWGIILALHWNEWWALLQLRSTTTGLPWPIIVSWWGLMAPVAYFGFILLHEGGHTLMGWLAGFRLLSFSAGPLHLTQQADGWQWKLQPQRDKLSGFVATYPVHPHHLRGRYALLIAGGPLANLLTGGLALYAHYRWLVPYGYTLSGPLYLLDAANCVFGWLSILVGALNLLPLTLSTGHIIDGKRLWDLARGGSAMHQHVGLLYFQYLHHQGTRPRDWDLAAVTAFAEYHSHSVLDLYAHYLAYCYYHDCRDLEKLRLHLNEALDRRKLGPKSMQQHILAEAAYVAALHTHNHEQARYWLDKAQQIKPFTDEEALFARAAVAHIEGNNKEANRLLQAARLQTQQAPHISNRAPAQECFDDLQARIDQAASQPRPVQLETNCNVC
ncbi:zinc metalloprotease [Hymenobacter metallilatus]|uniref:M50 family peptidase n=1 Tax=Hymenobacter metallilatus TaxID=2493666 RepID=A0A428JTE1_9BACT|nr:M50 family metallopeptidase [Hymenobacter metallilatus]RSK37222.1 M50 family peptidase [Hymenobacter metallilatus]